MNAPCLVNPANFLGELSCLPGITRHHLGVLVTGGVPGHASYALRGLLEVTLQNAVTERVTSEQSQVLLIREVTVSLVGLHILNIGIGAKTNI